MRPSSFFEYFTAEQALKDYGLDSEAIESGRIGEKGHDGGVDAVYLFANGALVPDDADETDFSAKTPLTLYLIQSKTSPGFKESPVRLLRDTSRDFLNLSRPVSYFEGSYGMGLLAAMQLFRDVWKWASNHGIPPLEIRYIYATKGDTTQVQSNVERLAEELPGAVTAMLTSATAVIELLGARELVDLTRQEAPTSVTLTLSEPALATKRGGYVLLVNLETFSRFISSDTTAKLDDWLFESNVRDHQGRVDVNQAIQGTLEQPAGEDFWWLNNGITMIAKDVSISGGTELWMEEPQIVNGMQTCAEIHKHFALRSGEEGPADNRNVMVRLIRTESAASRDSIIRATNSQTRIPEAWLRSTEAIHRNVGDALRGAGYYYDRRKGYHSNQGVPRTKIVSIPYVAQCVMSLVLCRPDDARARPSKLLKQDGDYNSVFTDRYPLAAYVKGVELTRNVEAFLQSEEDCTGKHRTNVRFHVATCVYRLQRGQARAAGASKEADALAKMDVDGATRTHVKVAYEMVWRIYQAETEVDKLAKSRRFVIAIIDAVDTRLQELSTTLPLF
jgi:hypothetical protein